MATLSKGLARQFKERRTAGIGLGDISITLSKLRILAQADVYRRGPERPKLVRERQLCQRALTWMCNATIIVA
jgi:uncharacterized protein (UPF0254 family)